MAGRIDELSRIDAVLNDTDGRTTRVLAISGEAGIGKSRLLDEIEARAIAKRWHVARSRCAELEGQLPFAAFVEALDDLLATPARCSWPTRDAEIAPLGDVFPSWGSMEAAEQVMSAERHRYHRSLRRLLERLTESGPLAVLLDDLHWADDGSEEALAHLLRRPPDAAVVLALAFRPFSSSRPLAVALAGQLATPVVEVLDLAPLTEHEADAMLAEEPDLHRRRQIFAESGGNPFFIQQLLRVRTATADGTAETPSSLAGDVPAEILASVATDVRRLSVDARLLLDGAAVVGDPFEPELAAEAAGLPESTVLDHLDELVEHDWVRPPSAGRRFRFRHPVVRRSVYEMLRPGWRLAAHARAAERLSALGAPAAVQAPHVALSARLGDEPAIELLSRAAQDVVGRAPKTAAGWLATALELLPAGAATQHLEFLQRLAGAQVAAGDLAAARDTLERFIAELPSQDGPEFAQAIAMVSSIEMHLGRHRGVNERLERAVMRQQSPELTLPLLVELAVDTVFRGDFAMASHWGDRALEMVTALDDDVLKASALSIQAGVLAMVGQTQDALDLCDRTAVVVDGLTDASIAAHLDILYHFGRTEWFLDRYVEASRHLARGVAVGVAYGNAQFLVPTRTFLAHALWRQGRLREALATAEDAVDGGLLVKIPAGIAWALIVHASALADVDLQRAMRIGAESLRVLEDVDRNIMWMGVHAHLAWILSQAGDHQAALNHFELVSAPDFPRLDQTLGCYWLEAVTQSNIALGRLDQAAEMAARAGARADEIGLPLAHIGADRAAAAVALAREDPDAAVPLALDAAAAAASCDANIEVARSQLLAGRAMAAAGRQAEAIEELQKVRRAATDMGADRFVQESGHLLRKLGASAPAPVARRPGDAGTTELSKRERQVAALVAEGRTNREIAEALFLSPKTIEGHLRRIFRKLNVASRAQVAAAVARDEA